jgi:choline kinase
MPFFTNPQALRLRDLAANPNSFVSMASQSYDYSNNGGVFEVFKNKAPHSSHPDFANLTLLVFEAVMEVVCVSAPGYIIARMGQFDAESQKFLANLNTQLFTPCLSEFVHATRSSAFAATPIAGALLTIAPQSSPNSPRS